uniref:Photosystem I reaction center subunit PsaK n=1 Tax=Corynoplastis japonica TaxID=700918 RepID=A0A1X9PVU0_9RHOD|nr:photosystem I reaction center subunit X [Corynoplastis japonica]
MYIDLLLSFVPKTSAWSVQVGLIMLVSNLFTIVVGRYAIKVRGLGPSLPLLNTQGLGLPELLATTSLGHIIGAGIIIGLV